MSLQNMFTHIFKNKYLYAIPDALRRGILLTKQLIHHSDKGI